MRVAPSSAIGDTCPTAALADAQVGKAMPFSMALPLKMLATSLRRLRVGVLGRAVRGWVVLVPRAGWGSRGKGKRRAGAWEAGSAWQAGHGGQHVCLQF